MDEAKDIKSNIARALYRIGFSANRLTFAGLLLAACSGYFIANFKLVAAGFVLLFSGLVDMMDGAVARVSNTKSDFGGILDSSLDRYGDGFILAGLTFYFFFLNRVDFALISVSAWLGSFLISYVRARAECEIDSCRVGFWERGERIGVLVLGLVFRNPGMAVLILGLGTHWTVFQRLALAYHVTSRFPEKKQNPPFFLRHRPRSDKVYLFKIGVLISLIFFVRIL